MSYQRMGEYIDEQRRQRGWSMRELSRVAKVSLTSVRRAINPDAHPVNAGLDVIAAIAKALRVDPVYLLRIGGLIELQEPSHKTEIRHLNLMFDQLNIDQRAHVLAYVNFLYSTNRDLFPPEENQD